METDGIKVNGIEFTATLACISYDNLGANSLLGFTESFNANNFCRFCLTKTNDMQSLYYEKDLQVRSNESHALLCAELQIDESLMGVKNSTIVATMSTFGFCDMLPN